MSRFLLAGLCLSFTCGCGNDAPPAATSSPPASHSATTPPAAPANSPPADAPEPASPAADSDPAVPQDAAKFAGRTEPFRFERLWVANDASPDAPPERIEFKADALEQADKTLRELDWLDPKGKSTVNVGFGKTELLTIADVRTDPATIAIQVEWKKGAPTDQFFLKATLDSAEQLIPIYETYLTKPNELRTLVKWE